MKRILVTGANGQVGWELSRSLMPLGEVIAVGHQQCDFTQPGSLVALMRDTCPDVVVNPAAYTAVDKAESDEVAAMQVNGVAPGILGEEARKLGALVVHYSTDYVFDGRKAGAYVESDPTCPLNVYGRSKLAGEVALQQSGCDHLIFRTSWVYAARAQNFVRTILRLAQEREELRIVGDQIGAPTWARNIADATAHAVRQSLWERNEGHFLSGTFNLTSAGEVSWYGFAQRIVEEARSMPWRDKIVVQRILSIPTEAYPTPAVRPLNSRLDCTKLSDRFYLNMPSWHDSLARCMSDLSI